MAMATSIGAVSGQGDADTHLRAGLAALRREEFDRAVTFLEAAADAHPGDPRPPAYLSGAYLAVGRPYEAEAAVERALAIDPHGFEPHLKAGELAMRFGDIARAEREFLAALRAAPVGTPEMDVARRWLTIARDRLRRSISLRAALPSVRGSLRRWSRALRGRGRPRRPRVAQTTLGQLIASRMEEDHR
jgi:tetratricopeptide (TPR) repeat protein